MMSKMITKQNLHKWFLWLAIAGFFALMYGWRFAYMAGFAATWDQVDFVLALDRYDLLAMRPHFPGYPYFILGGMAFYRWLNDPADALVVFNLLMTMLSAIPIYLSARRYVSGTGGILITLAVQCSAYIWIISAQPMSEASAVALLWWYWWSLARASDSPAYLRQLIPLLLYGLVMGTRLSYAAFGLGILLLWIYDYRRFRAAGSSRWKLTVRMLGLLVWALLFQSLWAAGLAHSLGSFTGLIQMALSFTAGHFNNWGGTATLSALEMVQRLFVLLFNNLIWTGMAVRSITIIIILALCVSWCAVCRACQTGFDRFIVWFAGMGLTYGAFAWLAQNIDKPRHITPLIGMTVWLLLIVLLKSNRSPSSCHRWIANALLGVWIVSQTVIGMQMVKNQATERPAVYQLADGLDQLQSLSEKPIVLYTWEETRVLEYLHTDVRHKRIYTYDFFIEEVNALKDVRILVTGKALDGFSLQGADLDEKTKLLEVYNSEPLFDPVYWEIRLYEWVR